MGEAVTVRIGPVASTIAEGWISNRQRLVHAARSAPNLRVNVDALDLLDVILDLWAVEAERSTTFDWTHTFDHDVFILVVTYWLELGVIRPDQREALGVPTPPLYTEAFTEAVVEGVVAALRTAGPEGRSLLDRLAIDP